MTESSSARRVLVTDGQERSAVAVCRSLAGAGFRVTIAADSHPAVAQWSRFCSARVSVPPAQENPDEFIARLESALRKAPHVLLMPGGDASLEVISAHRERLEPLLQSGLGMPPAEAVVSCLDKLSLTQAAARAGFRCPPTTYCKSVPEALNAAASLGYPVIVKPRRSVFERHGRGVREPGRAARDSRELATVVELFGGASLLQRAESGTVFSCSGVYAERRLLALSLARYRRTWPPGAGNAAFAETVAIPAGLDAAVARLLGNLNWQGIFELELLQRTDGSFAPLDLNPRTFGSIALAIAAGANLPAIWCDWLLGKAGAVVYARPGVFYRWEDAELRRLLREMRRRDVPTTLAVLRPRRRTVHPHFSTGDPAPLAARALYLLGRNLAHRRRGPIKSAQETIAKPKGEE